MDNVYISLRQLFLDYDAWLVWRIPYFNSKEYVIAVYLATVAVLVVAVLFIISAARAKNAITKWTNPAEGSRMTKRIRTSGALMIGITVMMVAGGEMMFHPLGFVVWCVVIFPMLQLNSRLQIDSFRPVGGPPKGLLQLFSQDLHSAVMATVGRGGRLHGGNDDARIRGQQLLRSLSLTHAKSTDGSVSETESVSSSMRIEKSSKFFFTGRWRTNHANVALSQESLDPWQRLGVSYALLSAFKDVHDIDSGWTTDMVCERVIKAMTRQRQCCFIELLHGHPDCPDDWLGTPTFFLSHWYVGARRSSRIKNTSSPFVACRFIPSTRWGYKFVDLVRAYCCYSILVNS